MLAAFLLPSLVSIAFLLGELSSATYLGFPDMATKTEERTAADKLAAARNKNLDLAIQQIAKDYGEGAIMRLGAERIVDIDVIPTGNILIDRALGVGGFRRGQIFKFSGRESSEKTRLALTAIAQAKKGGVF